GPDEHHVSHPEQPAHCRAFAAGTRTAHGAGDLERANSRRAAEPEEQRTGVVRARSTLHGKKQRDRAVLRATRGFEHRNISLGEDIEGTRSAVLSRTTPR